MQRKRWTGTPYAPGVELLFYRWVGGGTAGCARILDRSLACARRPYCLVMVRTRNGQPSVEVLADFRTLREAKNAYDRHGLAFAGLQP
jgi:hypothetical protein